ncbi:MAG: DHH family phosphoesterase [Clostridia bacterium]|nr:DHH family phosphoesterase [Clostridia bacterium]
MKTLTRNEIAARLLENDRIFVLMHKSPDGDAIGCAYGLCIALQRLGKCAMPVCSDDIPPKYEYITSKLSVQSFEPSYIVSVDLAATQLLGDKLEQYADKIDLCIDHHGSNTGYAKEGYVDAASGACTQIIAPVIELMGIKIDKDIANAIFTGITTDTGCFKYSNASAVSYRMAADMIDKGADSTYINRLMFDTKSRQRLDIERMALESMEFFADDKIAVVAITNEMMERSGAEDGDTDGIAGIPRQIEGVQIGLTLKEKENGGFKVSARSTGDVNVSDICAVFGGGGHRAAAGCFIHGSLEEVKQKIVNEAVKAVTE